MPSIRKAVCLNVAMYLLLCNKVIHGCNVMDLKMSNQLVNHYLIIYVIYYCSTTPHIDIQYYSTRISYCVESQMVSTFLLGSLLCFKLISSLFSFQLYSYTMCDYYITVHQFNSTTVTQVHIVRDKNSPKGGSSVYESSSPKLKDLQMKMSTKPSLAIFF